MKTIRKRTRLKQTHIPKHICNNQHEKNTITKHKIQKEHAIVYKTRLNTQHQNTQHTHTTLKHTQP